MGIYIRYKVWDKIIYALPNSNSVTCEDWQWISNFILDFTGDMSIILAGITINPC